MAAPREPDGLMACSHPPHDRKRKNRTPNGVCDATPQSTTWEETLIHQRPDENPTLFVCHGDEGGPKVHPCRRVQEAMKAKGIEYDKVIAAHGSPIPFLRKGSRDNLRSATGQEKLPALKLPDGTVVTHSKAILAWVDEQP